MTPFWKKGSRKKPAKMDRREAWQEVARRVGGTFEVECPGSWED